mmetsp:Transcript_43382/g.100502  ORF Transcript_43382/g.100502 Transcript_43382/m.100502 type:complete len:220 (+) Transcript_43382:2840-3499(+)
MIPAPTSANSEPRMPPTRHPPAAPRPILPRAPPAPPLKGPPSHPRPPVRCMPHMGTRTQGGNSGQRPSPCKALSSQTPWRGTPAPPGSARGSRVWTSSGSANSSTRPRLPSTLAALKATSTSSSTRSGRSQTAPTSTLALRTRAPSASASPCATWPTWTPLASATTLGDAVKCCALDSRRQICFRSPTSPGAASTSAPTCSGAQTTLSRSGPLSRTRAR